MTQDNQVLVELNDINKYYPVGKSQLHVLKELNLSIHQGEFIMIMGKSGSGKTTLMNIIVFWISYQMVNTFLMEKTLLN